MACLQASDNRSGSNRRSLGSLETQKFLQSELVADFDARDLIENKANKAMRVVYSGIDKKPTILLEMVSLWWTMSKLLLSSLSFSFVKICFKHLARFHSSFQFIYQAIFA